MFKKSFILIALLSSCISFSQEIVQSIPLELKSNKDVFQIVNESKKEVSLFISDKKRVKNIRLDGKMRILDSLSTNRPAKNYNEIIGYNGNESNYRLFWASSNCKEIFTQLFNFNNHKIEEKNYSFSFKNEIILEKFSQNNVFYILTILKKTNTLKLYCFEENGNLVEKEIDLTGFRFFKSDFQKTTFYGVMEENLLPFESAFTLLKIDSESPTSLTYSSKKRKCYSNGNQFIITIDTNLSYTQLITIDLSDYTAKEKFINKPFIQKPQFSSVNSNSFLAEDKIYLFKSSDELIKFTIKDLNDVVLNEYSLESDQPIDFKNSEIHQENGSASNHRILEKTSQFNRKVNTANLGVSCYKMNDNYIVTLGSVTEEQTNGAMMYGGMFGAAGVLIAAAITYNPTNESFNSYANRKVVYINCLFDKDAQHLKGDIPELAFNKIRTFVDNFGNTSSQTVFKLDNFYYLGYYDSNFKNYLLRKFEE